ncbi:MAG: hypothetical protein RR346_04445, partial [Bacteroidales bacterium]
VDINVLYLPKMRIAGFIFSVVFLRTVRDPCTHRTRKRHPRNYFRDAFLSDFNLIVVEYYSVIPVLKMTVSQYPVLGILALGAL